MVCLLAKLKAIDTHISCVFPWTEGGTGCMSTYSVGGPDHVGEASIMDWYGVDAYTGRAL